MAKVLVITGLLLGLSTTLSVAGFFQTGSDAQSPITCTYTVHGDIAGCGQP